MLRLVHYGNALPYSFPVDPSSEFQPGQVAELTVIGNQIMATVSNGTAPLGIIDDIRVKAFTNVSWNEVIYAVVSSTTGPGGSLVSASDVKVELKQPNIIASSFTSSVKVVLNPVNGVVTFLAGTPLNFDATGSGTPNAIRSVVNYTYQVPNIPGDDSTIGSGRVTIWYERMFIETDQFETNQQYPVKANVYVSETGLFTTRRPSDIHPAVGMVCAPPSPQLPSVQILWF